MSKNNTQLSTSSTNFSYDLKMLAQMHMTREKDMVGISADAIHEESDVKNYEVSPIFDYFMVTGNCNIVGNEHF